MQSGDEQLEIYPTRRPGRLSGRNLLKALKSGMGRVKAGTGMLGQQIADHKKEVLGAAAIGVASYTLKSLISSGKLGVPNFSFGAPVTPPSGEDKVVAIPPPSLPE